LPAKAIVPYPCSACLSWSRRRQEKPEGARKSKELLGGAKRSQEEPAEPGRPSKTQGDSGGSRTTNKIQEDLRSPRTTPRKENLGGPRKTQQCPGGPRMTKEDPGRPKNNQVMSCLTYPSVISKSQTNWMEPCEAFQRLLDNFGVIVGSCSSCMFEICLSNFWIAFGISFGSYHFGLKIGSQLVQGLLEPFWSHLESREPPGPY
jgi:hypothetical protein